MDLTTMPRNFIGIDMDSTSFDWYLMSIDQANSPKQGRLLATSDGLDNFYGILRDNSFPVISLEGFHGQNAYFEDWMRNHNLDFYSIPPYNVARFREGSISKNKNNKTDAQAVAGFIMNQFLQGNEESFHYTQNPNIPIRMLSRRLSQVNSLKTSEVSNLWKYIKLASNEAYIALKGVHPEYPFPNSPLQSLRMLKLLAKKPDLSSWSNFSDIEIKGLMEAKTHPTLSLLISSIKKLSESITSISPGIAIVIGQTARNIINHELDKREIKRSLKDLSTSIPEIKALMQNKGIGVMLASSIVSEVIDINRFRNDDHLASYAGFGRRENKSGTNDNMRKARHYNRYLKNTIMTYVIQEISKNPNSHFSKYYKEKLQQGHSAFYARKSMGRALIRRIYKVLKEQKT